METKTETSLTVIPAPAAGIYDRIADPMTAVETIGRWLHKSGMLGISTVEQGIVVALTCMHEGIHPIEFGRRYHIIEGRPSMRADYMHGAFLARGWQVRFDRLDDAACQLSVRHPERQPEWYTMPAITFKDMQEKGITHGGKGLKPNWARWPRAMLRSRAISEAVRTHEPGIVAGVYTPEEVMDFDSDGVVAAPQPVPAPKAEPPSRLQEALTRWKKLGAVQADLEGSGALGKLATSWTEEDWKRLGEIYVEVNQAKPSARADLIKAMNPPEPPEPTRERIVGEEG